MCVCVRAHCTLRLMNTLPSLCLMIDVRAERETVVEESALGFAGTPNEAFTAVVPPRSAPVPTRLYRSHPWWA